VIDRRGEIRLSSETNLFSRRGRSVKRSVVTGSRQFSQAILVAELRDITLATVRIFARWWSSAERHGRAKNAEKET
jgi:hypothetical protein